MWAVLAFSVLSGIKVDLLILVESLRARCSETDGVRRASVGPNAVRQLRNSHVLCCGTDVLKMVGRSLSVQSGHDTGSLAPS